MSSICECGCNTITGSRKFQKIHVDFDEIEKQINQGLDEFDRRDK